MKKQLVLILSTATILSLSACGHEHTWNEATCTTPKTCIECNEIEGEPLAHTWIDADCENPKYCEICLETQGEPSGHAWIDANCTTAKTCSMCKKTEGKPLEHQWSDATYTAPKTCAVCNETEGEPLPKQLIFRATNGEVAYTKDVIDTVMEKLTRSGLDVGYANQVIEDYFSIMEGKDISSLDMTILDNLISSLDKKLDAEKQAQQAQREENKQNQQAQQNQNNNSGNKNNNSGGGNKDNSSNAPSDWVTPEKEDTSNDGPGPGEFSIDLGANDGAAGDGGEYVTDIELND